MRKKIRWMLIGTLIMAIICLVCALLEIASAVSYISMLGPLEGAGTADMILYVINEAFTPVGAFFILMAIAGIEYVLMHLARKPEKKEARPPKAPKEKSAGKRGFGKKQEERPADIPAEYERPQQMPAPAVRQDAPSAKPDAGAEMPEGHVRPSGTKFPINTKRRNTEEGSR